MGGVIYGGGKNSAAATFLDLVYGGSAGGLGSFMGGGHLRGGVV